MTDIILAEQELSVEVGHLDVVVVGDRDLSTFSASETHHGKLLDVFTTECARTDHESVDFTEFLLNLTAVHLDLVIVTAAHRLTVGLLRKRLKDIVMKPLSHGGVLSSPLDNFLGNDSTEEGSLRADGASSISCGVQYNLVVKLLDEMTLTLLRLSVDLLGHL